MGRDLKFRSWNYIKKCFFTWDITMGFEGSSAVWGPVEQFTGLLDKNGKKIWEGDIISFNPHWHDSNDIWTEVVTWGKPEVCFFGWMPWVRLTTDFHIHDITVIGNIYENPELLKVDA